MSNIKAKARTLENPAEKTMTVLNKKRHVRNHCPKQDRDKPSTGVGTVVVLPSVPVSLRRGSCD